jgi:hypothetical protein
MAAEITDRFSAPIRDMTRGLRSMSDQVSRSHKEGVLGAREHLKHFRELDRSIKETASRTRETLAPAFEAFGVGAISAAAGVAAIAESIKSFVGQSRDLSFISREVGLTVRQLQIFDALAESVGSSTEQMNSSLHGFAENMANLRARVQGSSIESFFAKQPFIRDLETQLRSAKNNAEALIDIQKYIGNLKGPNVPQQQRLVLEAFTLPLELARKSGQEFIDAYEEIAKTIKELTPEQRAAGIAGAAAFEKLRLSAKSLKDEIGAELAPAVTELSDELTGFVQKNGPTLREFFHDIGESLKNANWSGFAHDVRETATEINNAAQAVGGWKVVAEGLVAVKLAGWAFRTAGAFKGLFALVPPAWMLPLLGGAAVVGGGAAAGWDAYRKNQKLPRDAKPSGIFGGDAEMNFGAQYGEQWGKKTPPPVLPPETKSFIDALRNSPYQPMAYRPDGDVAGGGSRSGTSEAINIIAVGTRKGVSDGMYDFYQLMKGDAGGGSIGAIRASFSPSNDNAGGGAAGLGGAAGAGSATRDFFKGYRNGGAGSDTGGGGEHQANVDPGDRLPESDGAPGGSKQGGGNIGWWSPQRRQQAIDYLKEHAGLSEMGAKGMVARWAGVEATQGPGEVNRSSGAAGIAQWLGSRKQGFKLGDFQSQLKHAADELNGPESKAGNVLKNAKTAYEAARGAAMFERAEGYNPRTGTDNWVGKTLRTMRDMDRGEQPGAVAGNGGGTAPISPGAMRSAEGPPKAFIMHHTGGGGTIEGLKETLRQRGLGVEYGMDRDGNIFQIGKPGAANILPGWGPKGQGLNNKNIVGMEVIAKNDKDVTKAQIKAASEFIRKNYPQTPVYGHGEVNPGHKEADEGMSITNAIRQQREALRNNPVLDKEAIVQTAKQHRDLFGIKGRRDAKYGVRSTENEGLLQTAKQGGAFGMQKHQVEGNAAVHVSFSGLPAGARTKASADGMFKTMKLDRGGLTPASEQG